MAVVAECGGRLAYFRERGGRLVLLVDGYNRPVRSWREWIDTSRYALVANVRRVCDLPSISGEDLHAAAAMGFYALGCMPASRAPWAVPASWYARYLVERVCGAAASSCPCYAAALARFVLCADSTLQMGMPGCVVGWARRCLECAGEGRK